MGWGGNGKGQGKAGARIEIQDPSKVIWIGGVPGGTHFKELLAFAQSACGQAKWAQVQGSTSAVGFATAAEATQAIAFLNGAGFNGATLQVDAWTGKATGGGKGGKSWGGGGKGVWNPAFQKSWGGDDGWGAGGGGWGSKGKGKGKSTGKSAKVKDPKKAVWVGNVPEGTAYKELLELAKSVSNEAKWAEVFKGSAAVGFSSEEAAAAAAISLNGAMLGATSIVADSWESKKKEA